MYSQNKQSFGYLLRKVCEGILYSNHLLMAHCEANPEEDSGVATLASGHGMSWGGGGTKGTASQMLFLTLDRRFL